MGETWDILLFKPASFASFVTTTDVCHRHLIIFTNQVKPESTCKTSCEWGTRLSGAYHQLQNITATSDWFTVF